MTNPFTRYVIMLEPVPGAGERAMELLQAHVSHLKDLEADGRLVLAGPFIGRRGGMVILNVETAAEAERIATADPFVVRGDSTFEVRRWLLSCAENDHLGMG